jgi:cation diffusion facilitator family transporter
MDAPVNTMSDEKTRAARLSIVSNLALVLFKLGAGMMAGSASILSEAAHSAADLLASGIAYLSVRASGKPADVSHPYGHGKIEVIAAVLEALLILLAAGLIIYHAVAKLRAPTPLEHLGFGIAVMAISAAVNWGVSRHLFRVARETESLALEADAHHLRIDVYTSLAVFAGLVAVAVTGQVILDSVIAIAVALLIVRVAWDLARESAWHLMDGGLPAVEMRRLQEILESDSRVLGYHKVRARRSGSQRHIDLHLLLDEGISLKEAHRTAEDVEDKIRAAFGGVQVVTHVEPATEDELAIDSGDVGIRKGRLAEPREESERPW